MLQALLGWLALYLVLAVVGTWLALRYARARNLMDQPGERRSHTVATPRGGGIAIVLAMFVALGALFVRDLTPGSTISLVAAGLLAVAGIGWFDDHRPLSPWLRLAVHGVAAVLLGLACIQAGASLTHAVLAGLLALVLVNVWNFMDGIDGLATTQALIAAAAFAVATVPGSAAWWLAWALAAACMGFLPFNVPRARIFLGDVGSGALGYLLAAVLALGFVMGPATSWWLLPLSAFLLDATLTLGTRMVRGERWWTPHVQHLYQQLARRWSGHLPVTGVFAVWSVVASLTMQYARSWELPLIIGAVCAWYLGGVGIWFRTRAWAS